jgi:hypothetical protein
MDPTSLTANGDKIRSMTAVCPVSRPGASTDAPLKTLTGTSSPLKTATPTSMLSSSGCPMSVFDGSDRGTKRTSPGAVVSLLPTNFDHSTQMNQLLNACGSMTRPSIDSALDIVSMMVKLLLHVHLQCIVRELPFQHSDIGLGSGLNYLLVQSISAYGLVRPEDNLASFILRPKAGVAVHRRGKTQVGKTGVG